MYDFRVVETSMLITIDAFRTLAYIANQFFAVFAINVDPDRLWLFLAIPGQQA